jgi:hypothetical protein
MDEIPVTSSDTTSGITVIRIALIQSAPMGWTAKAARRAPACPVHEMTTPRTSATTSANSVIPPSLNLRLGETGPASLIPFTAHVHIE